MVKSFRDNYPNQMLDQEVVDKSVGIVMMVVVIVVAVAAAEWKRRIDLRHHTRMLLDRMEFSRDLGPCMDSEMDRLSRVARRLRLLGECNRGMASR